MLSLVSYQQSDMYTIYDRITPVKMLSFLTLLALLPALYVQYILGCNHPHDLSADTVERTAFFLGWARRSW